jgi:phenylacetate-CoA ligase
MSMAEQLALYRQELARTEQMSKRDFAHYAGNQLAHFAQFAWRNVPYYRQRLAPLFANNKFNADAWPAVPVLTRANATKKYAELQTPSLPDFAGRSHVELTSGSTGAPLRFRTCDTALIVNSALTHRGYSWWKLDGNRTLGSIHYYSADWPVPLDEPQRGWFPGAPKGMSYALQIGQTLELQLDWLKAHRIDYLKTRPSAAEALAEENLRRGSGIRLAAILTVSEPVTQACRDVCRRSFGAEIYDTYGSEECGHLAAECSDCHLMHVGGEACLVEVVKDDLSPCSPGEVGRVLVTSFFGYAMPLIRYELGDYAELGPHEAPCGRPFTSLKRIIGRHSEMFVRRDGRRFFPAVVARALQPIMPLKQVQFVQTDYELVEIRYVPDGDAPIDNEAVQRYVKSRLGDEFSAKLVPLAEIPHAPGAKYLYHRSEMTV